MDLYWFEYLYPLFRKTITVSFFLHNTVGFFLTDFILLLLLKFTKGLVYKSLPSNLMSLKFCESAYLYILYIITAFEEIKAFLYPQ